MNKKKKKKSPYLELGNGTRLIWAFTACTCELPIVWNTWLKYSVFQGDTIVCSTSTKLNLNSGAAHSLIKHGGQKLQDECKKKFPEGIKNGELAAIDGGKLKCSKVYLTALPEWKDANGGKVEY